MDAEERQAHWENVYRTKAENGVSWFQETPTLSLEFIHIAGVGKDAPIIDIGGGESQAGRCPARRGLYRSFCPGYFARGCC